MPMKKLALDVNRGNSPLYRHANLPWVSVESCGTNCSSAHNDVKQFMINVLAPKHAHNMGEPPLIRTWKDDMKSM